MGRAGRERVELRFTLASHVAAMLAVYEAALTRLDALSSAVRASRCKAVTLLQSQAGRPNVDRACTSGRALSNRTTRALLILQGKPARMPATYHLSHLRALEAEAIHVMREVAAEFERPVLLFSGGKDSIVLLRLAEKAFRPAPFPFPLMHVDTGAQLPRGDRVPRPPRARARRAADRGVGRGVDPQWARRRADRVRDASRNALQTVTLLDAIAEHGFDAAFGGARRDEERARAKERILSFRDEFGQWEPHKQRPELWSLYNGRVRKGEHARVFPISNWTELDVWQYIAEEELEVPSIYFAHEREVFERDGMLYAVSPFMPLVDGEHAVRRRACATAPLAT